MKSKDVKKVMVVSDHHIPYIDYKADAVAKGYAKQYKPDYYVINGDLNDCYSISIFDKNPERKYTIKQEIDQTKKYLKGLKNTLPKKTKMFYNEGNHEARIYKKLWKDPEMYDLLSGYVNMKTLLELDKLDIEHRGIDLDYWKKDNGHLKLGDVLIMHGDNRLNGAKGGMNAAINTAKNMRQNTVIGHTHNLNLKYESNPYNDIFGGNSGCLCQMTGTANWQQGFFTFEIIDGKSVNPRTHRIIDGVLYEDGYIYKA
ncbi:MAG: metallophosphoesterase [Thermotogota bacterium]